MKFSWIKLLRKIKLIRELIELCFSLKNDMHGIYKLAERNPYLKQDLSKLEKLLDELID